MFLDVVRRWVYRFAAVESNGDERDFDRSAIASTWPDFNFAFYARLWRATCQLSGVLERQGVHHTSVAEIPG